jgi:copper chaperone CopZ
MNSINPNSQTYALAGLHCQACVGRVSKKLEPLADAVRVTLEPMQVELTNPRADFATLAAAVAGAGKYSLTAAEPAAAVAPVAALAAEAPAESWFSTYRPLLLILAYLLAASLLAQWGHAGALSWEESMRYFMAGFFLVFSFFKLLDIEAFADAYAGYDLLARRWRGWGRLYPFVELALGLAYLGHFNPLLTHWITVLVMGFSAIGVIQAVSNKRRIQCACLGAVFKLPMSTVTIVEDVGMVAMALAMLVMAT